MNKKSHFLLLFAPCSLRLAFLPRRSSRRRYPRLAGSAPVRLPVQAAVQVPGELFRREFSKLGYVEGKNIAFEYRYADDKLDRLPPWLMSWSVSKLTCSSRPQRWKP